MDDYTVNKQQRIKLILVMVAFSIFILMSYFYLQKTITLEVDGDVKEIKTFASTVEGGLDKAGIRVQKQGYINYPLDAKLENDMHLIIKEPKTYTVKIGDEVKKDLISPYDTVEEVLEDLDFKLGSKDFTKPKLKSEVASGDTIELFKVKEVFEEEEEPIKFEKKIRDNKDLDKGKINIVQKGEEGRKWRKIKKTFINDELESTEVVEEKVTKDAVTEIAERGTRQLVATTRGNTKYEKVITMNASAYDLSYQSTGKRPGDKGYGITASGTRAKPGVVAVDPRVVPLGTRLYIESLDGTPDYGYATAEDTGGAIKGNKIDLFFESANQVKNFGRRNVKVYILK